MIKNYLKIALRNLMRYKAYTAINILGLAIGMACVILILMYVQSELSVDQYHANKERIYRLNIQTTNPQTGEVAERAIGPYRLAEELRVDFSDFENIVRFAGQGPEQIEYLDQRYNEEDIIFADPEVLEVFDFPLLKGEKSSALDDPFSLVMTEKMANKYFGSEDPIGKVLNIRDRDFVVNGILKDIPKNTQLKFEIIISLNCAKQVFSRIVLENWGEGSSWTFAVTPENQHPAEYRERLDQFVTEKLDAWSQFSPTINMQALPSLYLHSKNISTGLQGGDIVYVYAFSFIAFFILLIACINFMNLSTARSTLRAKEVGLRKVVGAGRKQLISQFLSESTILAVISLIIGVIIARIALPYFNHLSDKSLSMDLGQNMYMALSLIGIALFVGIVAGSYPALLLSSFKPIDVLSGNLNQGLKGKGFRRILVSFQFSTSIFLIIITAIVLKQLNYCKGMNLGFEKENLVLIGGTPTELRGQYDTFQAALLTSPNIINAASSSRVPPGNLSSSLTTKPEGVPEDQRRGMQTVWTDFDFIETMGFELTAGRSFSRDMPSDAREAFIINEAAVKELGWTPESALNKSFGSMEIKDWDGGQWEERNGKVIGVLKNFHFESLKDEIIPTVYFVAPYMAWNYVIRIKSNDVPGAIAHVEKTWNQFNPETPFDYTFVDENFSNLYTNEERQSQIFGIFALLAIFIACLGLIGLASFTAEQKRKEIGIRKVLGASSSNLIFLLSKEFTILVIVAFLISSPIAWYVMKEWLQDFAYQTTIGPFVFLFSGLIALLVAWLTVGYQTAKVAFNNPIKSLKYE